MTKIKLVAVDLDDTLLSRDLQITGRVREAVSAVRAAGVHFTISTGRMYLSAARFARELGLDVPLITYQGALVKNACSGEVLVYRPLPLVCQEIVPGSTSWATTSTATRRTTGCWLKGIPRKAGAMPPLPGWRRSWWEIFRIPDRDPLKVLAIAGEQQLDRLREELVPLYRGKVHVSKSKPHFLEFSHPATRGRLAYLAGLYGIKREETMAVGTVITTWKCWSMPGSAWWWPMPGRKSRKGRTT